ncbi:hypothetical protein RRG08_063008 [Elysia crispata]|uniref:Uncharacterized protein n=1 Tax=Elysia crispata TaxID=231223 RepID=A0AAE1E404_9GAST|nr:hypothetical protein RRG08_063008 [Elysia crispata]
MLRSIPADRPRAEPIQLNNEEEGFSNTQQRSYYWGHRQTPPSLSRKLLTGTRDKHRHHCPEVCGLGPQANIAIFVQRSVDLDHRQTRPSLSRGLLTGARDLARPP